MSKCYTWFSHYLRYACWWRLFCVCLFPSFFSGRNCCVTSYLLFKINVCAIKIKLKRNVFFHYSFVCFVLNFFFNSLVTQQLTITKCASNCMCESKWLIYLLARARLQKKNQQVKERKNKYHNKMQSKRNEKWALWKAMKRTDQNLW